jgi:hypothetical protein
MDKEYVQIHHAIHNKELMEVTIGDTVLPIKKSFNGCRYVDFTTPEGEIIRFMEQNLSKNSQYAARARNNEKITWGIRKEGGWLKIDKFNDQII